MSRTTAENKYQQWQAENTDDTKRKSIEGYFKFGSMYVFAQSLLVNNLFLEPFRQITSYLPEAS